MSRQYILRKKKDYVALAHLVESQDPEDYIKQSKLENCFRYLKEGIHARRMDDVNYFIHYLDEVLQEIVTDYYSSVKNS